MMHCARLMLYCGCLRMHYACPGMYCTCQTILLEEKRTRIIRKPKSGKHRPVKSSHILLTIFFVIHGRAGKC